MNARSFSKAMTKLFAALFVSGCLMHSSHIAQPFFVSAYSQYRLPVSMQAPSSVVTEYETPTACDNTNKDHNSRRGFFQTGTAAIAAAVLTTNVAPPQRAGATEGVLSGKYCAYGEGSDCEDLAGGNPYILELQRKSAANKQANIKSAENAFYAKNYPDWFAAIGKTMVQKESDGTFIVVDNAELAKLWEENKISVKTPTTMGGRIKDVTQKPMLVLKE